jgi:hypothetical protein
MATRPNEVARLAVAAVVAWLVLVRRSDGGGAPG